MPGPAIVYLSPIGNSVIPFLNANGDPNANGFLNTFLAGTSTPSATYTTSAGTVNNAVSIPLGPDGRVPNEVWLVGNTSYKFVLTDSLGALIPGSTYDNIYGINDPTTFSILSAIVIASLTVSGTPSINLTGGQIAFPATQNPSANVNTLDDYEEGTWTPSIGGTATYANQTGTYTKIGNRVYIEGRLSITLVGTGSTTVVSGLPFSVGSSESIGPVEVFSGGATAIVSSTLLFGTATTTFAIWSRTAAATGNAANAIFANSALVRFSGFYFV